MTDTEPRGIDRLIGEPGSPFRSLLWTVGLPIVVGIVIYLLSGDD